MEWLKYFKEVNLHISDVILVYVFYNSALQKGASVLPLSNQQPQEPFFFHCAVKQRLLSVGSRGLEFPD